MSITQYKTPQHSSTCWAYKSYMDNNDIIRVCLQYYRDQLHLVSMLQRWYKIFLVLHVQLNCQHKRHLKTASQYDIGTSIASQASGWRQNRLDFYSNIVSSALASIQPIRLLKFWHQEYILTSKKNTFTWCSQLSSVIIVNQALIQSTTPTSVCGVQSYGYW